jgi:hypothetical protein
VRPSDVQTLLERNVTVPTRGHPNIVLEEFDGDELVVRISATPQDPVDGPKLADEILMAISLFTEASGDGGQPASAAIAEQRADD